MSTLDEMPDNKQNPSELELIHGKNYSDFHKKLDEGLLKIEEKYIDFFKERPGKSIYEQYDKLHNHWTIFKPNSDGFRFSINHDSDLPEYIKEECNILVDNLAKEFGYIKK